MNKILAFAASTVLALATSGADAASLKHRAPRGIQGYGQFDPTLYLQYLPRYLQDVPRPNPEFAPRFERFDESPMFAPDAPSPHNYNNPGIPDFQTGSRG